MKIGFAGLGAMGLPMAANLVRSGFDVAGFDLKTEAREAFAAAGGRTPDSVLDAARGADVLFVMVVSGDQALDLLVGDHGVAGILAPGAVVVVSSTQPPGMAQSLGKKLAERQLAMLDAPVSGGVAGAKAGSLTIMASGPRHAFDRTRPLLDAVGRNIFYLGDEPGQGSTAKLINQLLCGVHIAAAAEAMNLAERAGVSLQEMHRIISVSAGNSWMWADRGLRMMQENPPVNSAVDIFVKDLGIVLDHGRAARQALPIAAIAHQLFLATSGLGHGGEDDSQVIKAYRALNGAGE